MARNSDMMHAICSVLESMVRQYVQGAVFLSLQKLHTVLCDKRFWAFSITFNAPSSHPNSYLDVVLRMYARGSIHNVHFSLHICKIHNTGENVFDAEQDVLQGICGDV